MRKLFSVRNILGSLLFLILVGEMNVGAVNGLFTPSGFIVLAALYLFYFILIDAIVAKFKIDNLGLVLVNFALYSVLITGLLHGEIADYVLQPNNTVITTLIRIQCSFYPLFAYFLLRRFSPQKKSEIEIKNAIIMFIAFILVLSPSKGFGITKLINTIQIAPFICLILGSLAFISLIIALRRNTPIPPYESKYIIFTSLILLIIGLMPGLPFFLILLSMMIVSSLVFLTKERFRNARVV
jgi:hypothetical protein